MAVRDDIYVIESVSPRLIVVKYPSTEITVQDLLDTLRNWEADIMNLDADKIVQAAGKDDLGGGIKVGITITLLNAKLMFETRAAPITTGTTTSYDPNGELLTDTNATFISDGVYPGCTAWNQTTQEMATIKEVLSETQLRMFPLSGGTSGEWNIGDAYSIYPNEQCSVTGGNLVAVDVNGNPIEPIAPSANVQVVRTSSSSATLQELKDIQYSSFGGGVWVDTTSPYSGTYYPTGTPRQPVNNMFDALNIALERGFMRFYIIGNITLDNSLNFEQMEFVGESMTKTKITIQSNANVHKCEFTEATVTGTLDGDCKVKNCVISDINYISGYIELCVLQGTIVLGGGATSYFLDCWAGPDLEQPPVIDMGGSGQTLVMQNFNGYIKWQNKTGTEQADASLNAGWIEIDNTVINGSGAILGVGAVIDNSGPNFTLDTSNLVSPSSVARAVLDEPLSEHLTPNTLGQVVKFIGDIEGGRWLLDGSQMIFYGPDNVTEIARFDLYKSDGTLASEGDDIYERKRT